MKKIGKAIHDNIVFVIGLGVAFFAGMIYLSRATANLPSMDYLLYIDRFVDKMYQGGVTFDDYWNGNGVHRSPLQLFLFTCNVRLFGYNAQIGVALGLLLSLVVSIIIYREYKNEWVEKKTGFIFYLGMMVSLLLLYSPNQWEILTTEFYFGFEIRLLVFFLSFFWTNKLLHNKKKYGEYAVELSIFYILVICFSAGAYFAAYSAAIIFSIIFDFVVEIEKKNNLKIYAILFLGQIIGACIYMKGLSTGASSAGLSFSMDAIKQYLYGFVLMAGSSVIGCVNYSLRSMEIAGILLLCLNVFCIIVFYYKKMYKKSYVPMMFGAYVAVFCVEILYGRGTHYDIGYLTSSRYICETILFLLADAWILTMMVQRTTDGMHTMTMFLKAISVLGLAFLVFMGIHSASREWRRAPYIKLYYQNEIELLKNIDNHTDDELAVFIYEPDIIRRDVEVMKKYHLGVFRY